MVGSEACMHGVPVITTDVGGAKAFAMDERWVVQPGSVALLENAMNNFAEVSVQERAELSEKSRRRALSDFDLSEVAAKYEALYLEFPTGRVDYSGIGHERN